MIWKEDNFLKTYVFNVFEKLKGWLFTKEETYEPRLVEPANI